MDAEDLTRFLEEDLGPHGDVTSAALAEGHRFRGRVRAREAAVVAGLAEAVAVFERLGAEARPLAEEGALVAPGDAVLEVEGPAEAVLSGERLALNLIMRASGVATVTRAVAERVHAANPRCEVACTRKTTPGLRALEKRAVELGGGGRHREGLWDAFLVKDNHLRVTPDVAEAVARCRALRPDLPVEVEADRLEQALAAAEAGADAVLLDNFTVEAAADAYKRLKAEWPGLLVEVSGGLTPEAAPRYAPHADRVSLGFLTHSAAAADFGLDVE